MVVVYKQCNNKDVNSKLKFWNELRRVVDANRNVYRVIVMGDLNGWIGHKMRGEVTGAFKVNKNLRMAKRFQSFVLTGRCVLQILSCRQGHKYTLSSLKTNVEWRSILE